MSRSLPRRLAPDSALFGHLMSSAVGSCSVAQAKVQAKFLPDQETPRTSFRHYLHHGPRHEFSLRRRFGHNEGFHSMLGSRFSPTDTTHYFRRRRHAR